jgi:hypothetical protein
MGRRATRRQKGGYCEGDRVAYGRCKAGVKYWFKRLTSLIRPVLLKYIINNPSGNLCKTNSGELLRQFVRDEKSKKSMWAGLVWTAAEDRQANLQIRWIMDTIRTDNEFRSACARRDTQHMTLIMDEFLQRFEDHSCDAFDGDYLVDPGNGASCQRQFSKYDTYSNNSCTDLGYRVWCTDPNVLKQNADAVFDPVMRAMMRSGRRRRRSTLRST